MKKTATFIMVMLMMCVMTATALAATKEEKIQKERTKIEELSEKSLRESPIGGAGNK